MSNDISSVVIGDRSSVAHRNSSEPVQATRQIKSARNLQGSSSPNPATMSSEDIVNAVETVNQVLKMQSTAVRFKVDKQGGELVTSIYNTDTHELIREIPSQELREISTRLKEYQDATEQAGLLVDKIV